MPDRPVVLAPCSSYDEVELKSSLFSVLEPLGGIGAFVRPGERILIKPNLLAGRKPECAVTTHPALVAVMADLVRSTGAAVVVGDSPGLESTVSAAGKSGLKELLERRGVELLTFGPDKVTVDVPEGGCYRSFEVASALRDVDGVINMPKLKTHAQMSLTLGVKNTLGCIVGLEKAQLHLKAAEPSAFAKALLDLHDAVAPRLTVLDGIVGMQGNGPLSGTPVHTGLLAASACARSLDLAVAGLVGFSSEQVPTLAEAGLSRSDLLVERLKGLPESFPSYEPAYRRLHVGWLPFAPLRELLRRSCTPRPVFHEEPCVACYRCVDVCPAGALEPRQPGAEKTPLLELGKCIRCFCCQEVCPAGAVTVESGWAGRLLGRLYPFRSR